METTAHSATTPTHEDRAGRAASALGDEGEPRAAPGCDSSACPCSRGCFSSGLRCLVAGAAGCISEDVTLSARATSCCWLGPGAGTSILTVGPAR